MTRTLISAAGLGITLLLASAGTLAAHEPGQPGAAEGVGDLPPSVAGISSKTREGYLNSLMSPFRRAAGADLVLDQGDIDDARLKEEAAARASRAQNVLRYDLDADGSVTRAEVETVMTSNSSSPRNLDRQIDGIMAQDRNGDGRIEISEILADPPMVRRNAGLSVQLQDLLSLDPDKDGKLTGNELEAIGRQIFAGYDTDGDGSISEEESAAWQKSRREALQRAAERPTASELAACDLPAASPGVEVVLMSAYGSNAIANVTVAGQDETTVTSEVYVEPGNEPLYIVAATMKPRIWRFRGSTERVAQFVSVSAGTPQAGARVGIVGLPKERATFLPPESCFRYFTDARWPETAKAKRIVEAKTGQPVKTLVATYNLTEIALPSGITPPEPDNTRRGARVIVGDKEFELRDGKPVIVEADIADDRLRPAGVDPATYRNFRRYAPAGVVRIDPGFVVSPKTVERYEVLPEYAGIVDLLKNGSLEMVSRGEYRIVKPIPRYPAGLAGALSVKFVLTDGVPEPKGSPGHSCVTSEATGKPLANSGRCR